MDNIFDLARGLVNIYNMKLEMVKNRVRMAVAYDNLSSDDLEHLLDDLLDLYSFFGTSDIELMYMGICELLESRDKEAAEDYYSFLKEEKDDDEKTL